MSGRLQHLPKGSVSRCNRFRVSARVSTGEQSGTLKSQEKAVRDELKRVGYKKSLRGRIFSETASATSLERPALQALLEAVKKHKGKAVIVVRDVQRFTRNPYHLGVLYQPLRDLDIPLVSMGDNIVLGTEKRPNVNPDLLAPILVAAGGQEVSIRKIQTLGGVAAAKAKGISAGAPLKVFTKEAINPYRELERLLKLGIGQSEAARRLDKSTSWFRKNRDKLASIREKKGDAGVEEFISLTDLLRDYERENGPRTGPRAKNSMRAIGRMTSLYLQFPADNERPSDSFVAEVFANPKEFLPKRTK